MILKLIRLLLCFLLADFCCFAATLNIGGNIYQIAGGQNGWVDQRNNRQLDIANLQNHFATFTAQQNGGVPPQNAADILRELGRLILAQSDPNHNIVANAPNSDYAKLHKGDIINGCADLKNHILTHGHLGYYPAIVKPLGGNADDRRAGTLEPRGIFNINKEVAQRIFGVQLNHLAPATNVGFSIDPANPKSKITLGTVATELINTILSTNKINPNKTIVDDVQRNRNIPANGRFTIVIEYAGDNIPGIIEGPNLGFAAETDRILTNKIKIVVDVTDGFISIVTMYPV